MIFDIYEQADLFKIADCAQQRALASWLDNNRIPYLYTSKNKIIAHKHAVDAGLGVSSREEISENLAMGTVKLHLPN